MAARASSFGGEAANYERYRQGPPRAAVDWVVPAPVRTVVDLGAGTGRPVPLLVEKADEVVAVEPDDRMRAVLSSRCPGCGRSRAGARRSRMPDCQRRRRLASSSWHWMDPIPTLLEVGRVLVPGRHVAAVWSGPDPDAGLIAQAQALLGGDGAPGLGDIDDQSQAELQGGPQRPQRARPGSRDPTGGSLRSARADGDHLGRGAERR